MSTTQRVVRKQLAGAEDLLQGVGTVTQTRGGGTYDIHKLDVPIPMTSIAEMQASSAEFVRIYETDTQYTDYRRIPTAMAGDYPSTVQGYWQQMYKYNASAALTFATVAEMKANVQASHIGLVVEWLGYYNLFDGGGNKGVVVAAGADADDGGSYFTCTSGVQVKSYFNGAAKVQQFGAKTDGTDATSAVQAAFNFMSNSFISLDFGEDVTYTLNDSLTYDGTYFDIRGKRVTIAGNITAYPRITSTTTADLTYPTSKTSMGCLRGCAIFFDSLVYYPVIEGITFSNYRFGLAYNTPHNSPLFKSVAFTSCNVGIICYNGSQNYKLNGVRDSGCDVLWISSATAFPADHPNVGNDNYYTDGLTYDAQGNPAALGSHAINAYFDDWFVSSILRPSATSTVAGFSGTYKDSTGTLYADSDAMCRPSGRAFFIPFRNVRMCFGAFFNGLDMRGTSYRGAVLINTSITTLDIIAPKFEGVFGASEPDTTYPFFYVGSVLAGHASTGDIDISGGTDDGHPLINYTSRGAYPTSRGLALVGATPELVRDQQLLGFVNGELYANNRHIMSEENKNLNYDSRSGAAVSVASAGLNTGFYSDNNVVKTLLDGNPVIVDLPSYSSTIGAYQADILITGSSHLTGSLEVAVLNMTEGAWDIGEFYLETGSASSDTLTTAAAINNGDAYITVTSAPTNTNRYTRFLISTGVYVVLDYYDSTNKRLYVMGGKVAGLSATVVAGSTITRAVSVTTVKDFTRGWVALQFSGINYQPSNILGIKNLLFDYTAGVATAALRVVMRLRSVPKDTEKHYGTAAPTTGKWRKGAIVWNTNPASAAYIGWVCTTGGIPGTWKAFGLIA